MLRFDVHQYDERLRQDIERLERDKGILRKNKELIKQFADFCFAERISKGRISRYVQTLQKICRWLKRKELSKLTKSEVISLLKTIEEQNFSPWTIQMYRVVLRKFLRWLGEEELAKFKIAVKANETKLPEDMLTEDEVRQMIEKCDNLRDKALIACLWESAARASELLTMQILDVAFDEYGALIVLHGKTGARKLRLVTASPYLANWIENHPLKENREAPLWILTGNVGKHQPMTYAALAKVLRKVSKLARIKKKVHPHVFRHSRLTYLAKILTEQELKMFAGWVQASKMASIYVHLSARDTDEAILGKVYGIGKVEEKEREIKLKPLTCPRCKTINEATNSFCKSCGMALSLKAVMEVEKTRETIDKWMEFMITDPVVLKAMIRRTKQLLAQNKLPEEFKEKLIEILEGS